MPAGGARPCPRFSGRSGLGCPRPRLSIPSPRDFDVSVRHKIVVSVDFTRQFGVVEGQIGLALRPPEFLARLKVIRRRPILIENWVSPVNPPSVGGIHSSIAPSVASLDK